MDCGDVASATTRVLLHMYEKFGGPGNELLLMSELQVGGNYCWRLLLPATAAFDVAATAEHGAKGTMVLGVSWWSQCSCGRMTSCSCLCHCYCCCFQGHFSFVLYDGERKQVFAARDPTGSESLYYHLGSEGAAFASSLEQLPDEEAASSWDVVPPGHYVAGKKPQLHQFALTPEQLHERHVSDDLGVGLSMERSAHEAGHVGGLAPDEEGRMMAVGAG